MNAVADLTDLVGEWAGPNRLWLTPDSPVRESQTTASVSMAAEGRFCVVRYTWAEAGKPQEGLLVVGRPAPRDDVDAVWVDSWHMGDKFLLCRSEPPDGAIVSLRGSYAAPPGPDWGWRIVLKREVADAFRMLMYNVTPDGEEALAVEASYTRRT
ncbi:MAG: DUF1579 domain-containing protein [Phycisphaerales bacterium]|nr:MAG: DUF1579 domain-containing protein [Phycisphaerales bacterium]